MPAHDWTRVEAGIFHDFHCSWIVELKNALNAGLLPPQYYALAEQVAGRIAADVLALELVPPDDVREPWKGLGAGESSGGIAVAEAPPKTAYRAVRGTKLL